VGAGGIAHQADTIGIDAELSGGAQARATMVAQASAAPIKMLLADASSYLQAGRLTQAIACLERIIVLRPGSAEDHNTLGLVLRAAKQPDKAAEAFQRALALDPSRHRTSLELASACLALGQADRALAVLTQALRLQETPEAQALFVSALMSLESIAQVDAAARIFIARALSDPWVRPNEMVSVSIAVVKADRRIAECIDRAARAWPERLSAEQWLGSTGMAALGSALGSDCVLLALLENAKIAGVEMERFLTQLRATLLDAAMSDVADADGLALMCGIARQCHIHEYAFALGEREALQVAAQERRLQAAFAEDATVPGQWLAAFGAYAPLQSLQQDATLLARTWPKPVDRLLTQQVREPVARRSPRDTIQRLTPIEHAVSAAVRDQYEDNPYPLWVKAAPVGPPCAIDALLRTQFPNSPLRDLGKTSSLDVLIAGCGTGQESIEYGRKLAGFGHLLAVDLSLASLCYAKSKSLALGLDNIEYAQADLLELGSIGRSFDVIITSGVLHHLADPLAGWRTLLACLRPNGLMCIGLYSEIARRDVVAARTYIAERGYGASADGYPPLPTGDHGGSRRQRSGECDRPQQLLRAQRLPRSAVPRAGASLYAAHDQELPDRQRARPDRAGAAAGDAAPV
jgi:SAM-dependent methyltransferase